jgi:hypothetical protein
VSKLERVPVKQDVVPVGKSRKNTLGSGTLGRIEQGSFGRRILACQREE